MPHEQDIITEFKEKKHTHFRPEAQLLLDHMIENIDPEAITHLWNAVADIREDKGDTQFRANMAKRSPEQVKHLKQVLIYTCLTYRCLELTAQIDIDAAKTTIAYIQQYMQCAYGAQILIEIEKLRGENRE